MNITSIHRSQRVAGTVATAASSEPPRADVESDSFALSQVTTEYPQKPILSAPLSSLEKAFDSFEAPECRSDLRLLSDNAESWTARWSMMESATDNINAQYYAWDKDVFGMAMLGHAYWKARQGVNVNVMIDAVGDTIGRRGFKSHIGGRDYLQELVALPTARAKVYHPNHRKPLSAILHPFGGEGIAANHDKILEVDGRSVIAGGRNISHHYYMNEKDDPTAWRDTDLLLEGEASAAEFREAFDVEFNNRWVTEEVGRDKFGNWRDRSAELLGAYKMMDSWLKQPPLDQNAKEQLRSDSKARTALAGELVTQTVAQVADLDPSTKMDTRSRKSLEKMAGELVHHLELRGTGLATPQSESFPDMAVKVLDSTSTVGKPRNEFSSTLVPLIDAAQESIDIQSPYFVLTQPAIDAFRRAGERGVKIRIATNTPSSTDSSHTQVFFLNDWKKALATIKNLEVHGATGERKMHGKLAVFDQDVTLVTSYNMDWVSQEVNGEVGTLIKSKDFAKQARADIDKDYAEPTVGYKRYDIARSDEGMPLDSQGLPALAQDGSLIAEPAELYGPQSHVDPSALAKYEKKVKRWNWIRNHFPQFKQTREFIGR